MLSETVGVEEKKIKATKEKQKITYKRKTIGLTTLFHGNK